MVDLPVQRVKPARGRALCLRGSDRGDAEKDGKIVLFTKY
jgi:hypothetical protein